MADMPNGRLKYAMISTEMRRDLDEPLRHFQHLDIVHLYRSTPMNDLVQEDYGSRLVQYSSPWQLLAELRRIRPDVVQLLEPFALVNLPYLIALRSYLRNAESGVVAITLENVPLSRKYTSLGAKVFQYVAGPLFDHADIIYYLNDGARDNLLACGADPQRMHREMYGCWGVDIEEFSPHGSKMTLSSSADEIVFLSIGRMVQAKGIFDIVHAFASVRQRTTSPVRLVLIGDGSDRPRLESEIARLNLQDSVDVLGTIKNRDLAKYIRASDIFVLAPHTTRLWAEQVGMAFIQAMACAVPVIGTTSGSIPEFIPAGEAGFLVSESDIESLEDAMVNLVENADLRHHLGLHARTIVEARYNARENIQRIEKFLIDVFHPTRADTFHSNGAVSTGGAEIRASH